MRVIIGGEYTDKKTGFVDVLIEDGIFTDVGDIENPPEDPEIAILFPKTCDEVIRLISQVKNNFSGGLIFILGLKGKQDDVKTGIFNLSFEEEKDNIIDRVRFIEEEITAKDFILFIKAQIRKTLTPDFERISINIEIDADKKQLQLEEEIVRFTSAEFDALSLLLSNPGQVFSREEIKNATDSRANDLKTVDVWFNHIRQKLQNIEGLEIETIRFKGYALKVSDDILFGGKQVKHIENLQFDTMRGRLFSHYNEITRLHLTPREVQIMEVLLTKPGKLYAKEFIFDHVYSARENEETEMKVIDIFICKIRDRLGIHRDCVETHWGEGYSFNQKAYEKLLIAKRDFEVGNTIDDVVDGQDLERLLEKEYDTDWLIYLKVLSPESEVTSLIRIHYDSIRKIPNVEVFDSTGFRSIRQAEVFDIIAEQGLEKFDDFYAGVRGFMEVRNQDALTGENTWEYILKTVSRSGFWEGRTYRGHCESLDKSVELLKVEGQIYIFTCDKDYYGALIKTSLDVAGLLFSGKHIKKLSISKPGKNNSAKPKNGVVRIMTADGIIEQPIRHRTSSRFIEELKRASTFEEKYNIFTKNVTPNLSTFLKITNGTMRQQQFVIQLSRIGTAEEIRIKFYDSVSRELYGVTLEEAKKLFENIKMEPISVQQNIKQIFFGKPIPLSVPQGQTVQKAEQVLQLFSIVQIQEKIQTFITEKKTGILLTAFGKIGTGGQFTLTVMNMGKGIEFRIDIFQKTNSSQNYKDFSDLEKYCQSIGCTEFTVKS